MGSCEPPAAPPEDTMTVNEFPVKEDRIFGTLNLCAGHFGTFELLSAVLLHFLSCPVSLFEVVMH